MKTSFAGDILRVVKRHAARSRGKIPFVQGFDFVEVLLERLSHHTG